MFRAFILDAQREHFRGNQVTNINITIPQDSLLQAMPPAFISGAMAEELPKQISGFQVIKDGFGTNKNGVEFGFIEANYAIKDARGTNLLVYQKLVFFEIADGSAMITLTTPRELKSLTLPIFDSIIETIKPLKK